MDRIFSLAGFLLKWSIEGSIMPLWLVLTWTLFIPAVFLGGAIYCIEYCKMPANFDPPVALHDEYDKCREKGGRLEVRLLSLVCLKDTGVEFISETKI